MINKELSERIEARIAGLLIPPVTSLEREHAADLRALFLAAQGQEWRDIESAPRDGTWIVVSQWNREEVRFTRMFWASIAQWTERWSTPRWWDGVEPSGLAEPTHWMATVPPNPSAVEG